MWKRALIVIFAVIFVAFIIVFAACATFPKRDAQFENEMRAFALADVPGTEFELFNGKDLSGWYVHGIGKWTVQDGVLTAKRGMGYLATRCDEFDDFILTLEIRVNQKGNSGVFFRAHKPGWTIRPWPIGYEAQVDNHDPKNPTGSLYDLVTAKELLAKDQEWFKMEIIALGETIRIKIDGETVVDTKDPTYQKGFIALQAHDPLSRIDFRNIRIRIPESEGAINEQ